MLLILLPIVITDRGHFINGMYSKPTLTLSRYLDKLNLGKVRGYGVNVLRLSNIIIILRIIPILHYMSSVCVSIWLSPTEFLQW